MTLSTISVDEPIYYYFSAIGGVLAIFIAMILILLTCRYIKQNPDTNPRFFYFFIILCFVCIIGCIPYAFIRSNFITRLFIKTEPEKAFNWSRCQSGYLWAFISVMCFYVMIYFFLLYRTIFVFKDSAFELSKSLTLFLFIAIVIASIVYVVLVFMPSIFHGMEYTLEYFGEEQIYCSGESPKYKTLHLATNIIMVVLQTGCNTVLAYVFIKRLWKLGRMALKEHQWEAASGIIEDVTKLQSNAISMDDLRNKRTRSSVLALKYYDVTKRMTILILVMVIPFVIWVILLKFVSFNFILEIPWLALINIISLWLMVMPKKDWDIIYNTKCCQCCDKVIKMTAANTSDIR